MKRFLTSLLFVTFGIASLSAGEVETAFSPDGKIRLSFSLSEDGRPQYSVDCGELPAVLTSGMGFELMGNSDDLKSHLDREFEIAGTSRGESVVSPMRRGILYGEKRLPSEIITMNCWST